MAVAATTGLGVVLSTEPSTAGAAVCAPTQLVPFHVNVITRDAMLLSRLLPGSFFTEQCPWP